MPTFNKRLLILAAGMLFAASACHGNATLPNTSEMSAPGASLIVPNDNTSILKKLKKDVEIGSTIDPKNGDMGPRAISLARSDFGLKKGQLVVCNFEDSAGTAGKGTTIEVLDPKPHSKPSTFTQSNEIAGCDGDAITAENNTVYGTGLAHARVSVFNENGQLKKSYSSHIEVPFADADAFCGFPYAPEDIYIADSKTGALIKLAFIPVSRGPAKLTEVMTGFAVNKGTGWSILGPSGIQYNGTRTGNLCNDTLYIVDGANNTIVSVSNASNLLTKDEIVVQPGGKKFKCAHPKKTCATLVYSGAPLDAPVASALLPNGNLIVANTKGGNKLVELTPAGKVLDTKVVDTSKGAHVFGLIATGTDDSDTAVFYTDTATNTLQELKQ